MNSEGATRLATVIGEYAAAHSNPVLDVVPDSLPFEPNRRYPDPPIEFGNGQWRAFYHSHPTPQAATDEHGHFHLFRATAADATCWSHVAALAMDSFGQPSAWFTVNRWVTDECWQPADVLQAAVGERIITQGIRVERWLAAMVECYAEPLTALLRERDTKLATRAAGRELENVLDDRSIYELSRTTVDLLTDLARALDALD